MFEEQKACRTNSGLTTKQNVKTAARAGVARALPAYRESLPAGRLTAEYKHLNVSPELFNVSPPGFYSRNVSTYNVTPPTPRAKQRADEDQFIKNKK